MEIRPQWPHMLYVDPDAEQCQAFGYALLDHAKVVTAQDPEEALRLLAANSEIAVIVVELQLGQMSGVKFLQRAHEVLPGTVNLLVTAGLNDTELFMDAINSGLVWSAWKKTDDDYLRELPRIIAQAAAEQARRQVEMVLALAAREVVRVLVQHYEKPGNGRVARCEHLAQLMRSYLDLTALELALLPVFALVHGLESVVSLSRVRELLGDLPTAATALRPLTHALGDARERFDGTGLSKKADVQIAVLVRVFAVVDQFDRLMGVAVRGGSSVADAIAQAGEALQSEAGKWFDPSVVTALAQMVREKRSAVEGLYWKEAK